MTKKVLVLILLLSLTLAQPAYQQRRIFIDETDNVCRQGAASDQIDLIVQLDGNVIIHAITMGSTYCYEWLFRYQDKISPGKLWDYITKDGTKLFFDETTEKSYLYGLLISMVQTSTVRTPALIKGDWKDCSIVGDGKIQHFGAPGYEHSSPPQHYVRCTTPNKVQTK